MSRPIMRRVPSSTYRLQLRGGVDLGRVRQLVPYLAELGSGWLYLSPIFSSRHGSMHGYDVVDPTTIDPSLGTLEDMAALVESLHAEQLGLLLDVVPNHMTAHVDNPWWRDLLEHGRASSYAQYFDIRWSTDPEGRLVLPLLGRHYGAVLEAGELVPGHDDDGFVVRYHEHTLPLDPRTWAFILQPVAERLPGREDVAQLVSACLELPPHVAEPAVQRVRSESTVRLRASLRALLAKNGDLRATIDAVMRDLGGRPGDPRSFDALHRLLEEQAYRITYWRSGLGELNYRRFFDITELVALRSERDEVFEATHQLVLELVRRGWANGLRVDHVDGLADPEGYLRRLREAGVPYLVVEKILEGEEPLRGSWPADGTTGYEFIAVSLPLFIDPAGWERIEAAYRAERGDLEGFEACVRTCKNKVIDELFAPAVQSLAADLRALSMHDRGARDVSQSELEGALRAVTVALPVYRTYRLGDAIDPQDERILVETLQTAREETGDADRCALDFVGRLLLGRTHAENGARDAEHAFVRRWQQLTGPIMAKGLEDTALYRYLPLVALNEVGTHPHVSADPLAAFHRSCQDRVEQGGAGLLVTSTHDTKRGEDVRARLCVLSELDDEWHGCRTRCLRALRDDPSIDLDVLDLLLQTFVGAWPLDEPGRRAFRPRLHEYMIKAAREAKQSTSWLRPDPDAERRIILCVNALLDGLTEPWGRSLAALAHRVAFVGAINGLAQTLIKLASPGVADVYQGTELWDFSLVDPDNRRPVDFERRRQMLGDLRRGFECDPASLCADLRDTWRDGRIKMHVVWRGLAARREHPGLWIEGGYDPLFVDAGSDDQVCAFARRQGDRWGLAVAARRVGRRVAPDEWPLGEPSWSSAAIRLPPNAPTRWLDALTGRELTADDEQLHLREAFASLPVALLTNA